MTITQRERRVGALLADVGGTNTRVAFHGAAGLQDIRSQPNDGFDGIAALLAAYLRDTGAAPRQAVLAIAGPVGPGVARLTNRDWAISAPGLAEAFGLERVRLVNDLEALAMALPGLEAGDLDLLRPGQGSGNGQRLVANCGTGFNVGLLRQAPAGPVAFAAELGHAALPAPLAAAVGEGFATVEHLFSGAGLARLHQARTGELAEPAALVARAAASDAASDGTSDRAALETVITMGRLLGLLARQLVCSYLPRDGLYFAGSMARGVLALPAARAAFLAELDGAGDPLQLAEGIALAVITQDAAALTGLAVLADQP